MIVVDSNVILRFFLRDNEVQAKKALELFESKEKLFIPESVFTEIDFVLRRVYKKERSDVLKILFFLTRKDYTSPPVVYTAIQLYQSSSNSLVDCVVAAHAKKGMVATFDRKLVTQTKSVSYWK